MRRRIGAATVPPNYHEDRVLSVDANKFTLGIPSDDAFALARVTQGTPVKFTSSLSQLAATRQFAPNGAATRGGTADALRPTRRRRRESRPPLRRGLTTDCTDNTDRKPIGSIRTTRVIRGRFPLLFDLPSSTMLRHAAQLTASRAHDTTWRSGGDAPPGSPRAGSRVH